MPGEDAPGGDAPAGPEERLITAEAAAPEATAAIAPRPPGRPGASHRAGIALALLAAGLLLVVGVGLAARCRGGGLPAAPRTTSATGEPPARRAEAALPPLEARLDPATGEEVAPFSGFALSVETEPAGALVTVNGTARGEAPVLAGVDCAPGDRIEVRAERRGRRAARATVECRQDALVKLTLHLGR